MNVRPRISIPPATWAYLFILAVVIVGSVMREINLLMILSGLMCGPLIINWQMARSTLQRISLRRRLPDSVFAGEPFSIELLITNGRHRIDSWGLILEDRIRNVTGSSRSWADSQQVTCLVPHVAVGQEQSVSYRARLWQRGRYRCGPIRLSTKAPLGLVQSHVVFRDTDEVIVLPRMGQLTSRWATLVAAERVGQRNSQRRQGPAEGDFYGLREWRSGDSRRLVHWRSSAKRQTLVVRQFERKRGRNFVVLLDLGCTNPRRSQRPPAANDMSSAKSESAGDASSRETPLSQETIERAIRFTGTVIADLCQRGSGQIGLGVAGEKKIWRRSAASPVALREWLELLAEVEQAENDTWPELMQDVARMMAPDDQPIVISIPPLDLNDRSRFPELPHDISGNSWRRAIGVSVPRGDLQTLFVDDEMINSSAVPAPHLDRTTRTT